MTFWKDKTKKSCLAVNFNDIHLLKALKFMSEDLIIIDAIITTKIDEAKDLLPKTLVLNYWNFIYYDEVRQNCFFDELDAEFLRNHSQLFVDFIRMAQRLFFYKVNFCDIEEMFVRLFYYFNKLLEDKKFDVIIFESTPHMGFDWIIYFLAKSKGIKTLIIERTFLGMKYIILQDVYDRTKVPIHFNSNCDYSHLFELLREEIKKDLVDKSIFYTASKKMNSKTSMIARLTRFVKRNCIKNLMRKVDSSVFGFVKWRVELVSVLMHLIVYIKYYYLSTVYKQYSVKYPDLKKKFIYFPLHFQPERSTSPLGDIFNNQYFAITLLSNLMSQDCYIYVKEHPRQLHNPKLNTLNARRRQFYKDIAALKNVYMIDININNDLLIKNCIGTATITGSTGWEGLLIGKPVLAFGFPWYRMCRSCYVIQSNAELVDALKEFLNSTEEKVREDTMKFLLYIQENLFESCIPDDRQILDLKEKELMMNLSRNLKNIVKDL